MRAAVSFSMRSEIASLRRPLLSKKLYFKVDRLDDEITMWQLFKEFILFLRQEKKWWLIPLVIILLLLAAIIVFTGGSVLAPLMYPFI